MTFIGPLVVAIMLAMVGSKLDAPFAYHMAFFFLIITVIVAILDHVSFKGDR